MKEKITSTKNIRQELEKINKFKIKKLQVNDTKKKYKGLGLNWRDVVILTLALFFVGLYQVQAHAENYFDLKDIDTAMMLSYNTSENNYGALTLLKSDYSVNISGIVAEVKIIQTFQNQTLGWISEGMYAFPIAKNAAVDSMKLRIGKRIIEAEIHEKSKAVEIYETAKNRGLAASIVKQYRPNLFTTEVANIMPNEKVQVEISYHQTLTYESGHVNFHLPLAIKSRYMQDRYIEDKQPISSVRDDEQNRTIEINLEAGFNLSELVSLNHNVDINNNSIIKTIKLKDNVLYDKHDFVLRWYPALGYKPQAAMFSEKIGKDEYVLMMVMPTKNKNMNAQKREVVFIIDTSGSMHGKALNSAKDALYFGLSQLEVEDKFNIIEFNSSAQALYEKSEFANDVNLDKAIDFIEHLKSNGGTNMEAALTKAMKEKAQKDYLKQIIFITDGSVGNEAQLFKQIDKQINQARLFTVAIGEAPNNYFMTKAAQIGKGTYTNVAELHDVDEVMNELFIMINSPVLTDIEINWNTKVEQNPQVIPDLYSDQPVMITAKMQNFETNIELNGLENKYNFKKQFKLRRDGNSKGIAKLWARNKIEDLTDDLMLGISLDDNSLKKQITNIALKYSLVSEFTSLVAVDKNPDLSRQVALQAREINQVATLGQVNFPQTALGWKWKFLLGILLILFTWIATKHNLYK